MKRLQELWRRGGNAPRVSAVVLAGGSSARMGGVDKLAAKLGGRSVLAHSLTALQASELVEEIVVVARKGAEKGVYFACEGCDKISCVVHGGETRTASAYNGVMAVRPGAALILIHDAARPLLSQALIRAVAEAARQYGAAVPVTPVQDTVKRGKGGFVEATPPRETLFAAQTPQGFEASLIKAALTQAMEKGLVYTDDCAAVEALGMRVRMVEGDLANRKITTPPDLYMAEALLRERPE